MEETSSFFGKLAMWRAFICSTIAYASFRMLNPLHNGKTVMLETSFSRTYHYAEFCCAWHLLALLHSRTTEKGWPCSGS
jgi:hypothetical protein